MRTVQSVSSVDFPRSPHSDACADTGLCCSHAAYCHFHMFECLDVAGFGGMGVCAGVGGGAGREVFVGEAGTALKFTD